MNYEKIYNSIIERAISLNRVKYTGEYFECHHILPKSLGGSNKQSNLVLLTAKEHYLCHFLLTFIHPKNNSINYAFWMMINKISPNQQRVRACSRVYELAKRNFTIAAKELWS